MKDSIIRVRLFMIHNYEGNKGLKYERNMFNLAKLYRFIDREIKAKQLFIFPLFSVWLFYFSIFFAVGCSAEESGGISEMKELKISVVVEGSEFLSGEYFKTTTTLMNTGKDPIEVHNMMPVSYFDYELRSPDGSKLIYAISHRIYKRWVAEGQSVAPPVPSFKSLLAGESISLTEDLVKYSFDNINPGRYQLIALYSKNGDTIRSQPVEIKIVPPRINQFTSTSCLLRRIVLSAFIHKAFDDKLYLFFKGTYSHLPQNGTYLRIKKISDTGDIGGLAVAVHTDGENRGYWISWLQNGSIFAAKCFGNVLSEEIGPVPLKMNNPRLVKTGIELSDYSGLFVVVGEVNGKIVMQQLMFGNGDVKMGNSAPLCDNLPDLILPHYRIENDKGRLYLVWVEKSGENTKLLYRSYSTVDWISDSKPTKIYQRKSHLSSLEISVFRLNEPIKVHALFGPEPPEDPENERPRMFYVTSSLDNSGKFEERFISVPEEPVDRWAISSLDEGPLPIIAKIGDKLYWTQMIGGSGWQILTANVPDINFLHILSSINDKFWAEWVNPLLGVRQAEIPCQMIIEDDEDQEPEEDKEEDLDSEDDMDEDEGDEDW